MEDGDHDATMQAFIERWNLQQASQEMLLGMEAAVSQRVMEQFNPRDTSRDVNAIFQKFAGSVATGAPQRSSAAAVNGGVHGVEQVASFVEQWALGPEAQAVLLGLQPVLQQRVMRDFQPRDTSRDCNIIFIKFAQGLAYGKPRAGSQQYGQVVAPAPQAWPPQQHLHQQQQQFHVQQPGLQVQQQQQLHHQQQQQQHIRGAGAYVSEGADDAGLQEFIGKWNLQEEAQTLIYDLDPSLQAKVVQEFAPRDTARDCNAIFCKFVQGLAATMGKGAAAAPYVPYRGPPSVVGKGKGGSVPIIPRPANYGGGAPANVSSFVMQWNLREDAQAILYSLPPEAQQKVLTQFAPRDASTDVNNIFMKFAQGIARATGAMPVDAGGRGSHRYSPYS